MRKASLMASLLMVLVLAAVLGTQAGCQSTCSGSDLERSVQVIEQAWLAGLTVGEQATYDLDGAMQRLIQVSQQLSSEAQRLPPPCQQLIQAWSEAIGEAFQSPSSGTTCHGGVCCDSSGCLG